jgi:hypothetical protein
MASSMRAANATRTRTAPRVPRVAKRVLARALPIWVIETEQTTRRGAGAVRSHPESERRGVT